MRSTENNIVIATLYKFVRLPDYRELRQGIYDVCRDNGIRGTVLLAPEGINGTVAGSREGIDNFRAHLDNDTRLNGLEYKESSASAIPFHRLKVRLKKEIVTMGQPDLDPSRVTGVRVEPQQWNELISSPDVLLIDTRNLYEYEVGTFKNAVSPGLDSFREFPEFVRRNLDRNSHKRVAMFCTGGIRCEKASAYMLEQGFEQVYQLKGGILRYLQEVRPEDSLWEGECFVFDGRVAVDDNLQEGSFEQCYSCRHPVSAEDRESEKYEQGVSCPRCFDTLTDARRTGLKERQRQVELAAARDQLHVGATLR